MRIVSLTYARCNDYVDPISWISRIESAIRVLEAMSGRAEIVSMHCIGYEGTLRKSGVEYIFLRLSRFQALLPFRFHRIVRNTKPDVVIVHGIIFSLQIILLRMKLGRDVRIVVQHHAERPWGGIRGVLQRIADNCIDVYLFAAKALARQWIAMGLIANTAKIEEFMSASSIFMPYDSISARQTVQVIGERVYLWVGRLDSNKDPVTVLKAFLRFAQRNRNATFYLIYQTGEFIDALTKIMDDHPELQDHVHLVGRVHHADLQPWYCRADFVISGSH